ncbi:carboxypeptidase regulatory-like domain-containing protein [Actinocrispum sp. NPDC049592]|uniref:carboxypeptidase regulatory-like domain-containing protein n=1 Tax=Actinocrispum sp. NPDC049592 TaxID=3154835 RepID=UPI003416E311
MTRLLPLERSSLFSPAWLIPFDEYNQVVRGIVRVSVDRWDGAEWRPADAQVVRTPSGAFAFPGLGRRFTAPVRHRVLLSSPGYQPLYPADDVAFDAGVVGVEFVVHPDPPAVGASPRLVRLLPDVTFAYPPGGRVVHGVVRDANTQAPIVNALVSAAGQVDQVQWRERTLSGAAGAFRLSLRWPADGGPVAVSATDRPGRGGSVSVRLPQDVGASQVIEIS